jgi:hypothetical protein
MSGGEMLEAADPAARYDIARVHSIDEDGARVRIARDIGEFARKLLGALTLPAGVKIDSFSVSIDALAWGEEFEIDRPDDEEE